MSGSLTDRCVGRWPELLTMLGVDGRYLNGKHGPCPVCQQGKDRFRFDDKAGRGSWICSTCGAGDGFALAMKINGWDFKEVAERVEGVVGKIPQAAPAKERSEQALKDAMNRLWTTSIRVQSGDIVDRYLTGRGILLDQWPVSLRRLDQCRYQGDGEPTWHPAMIAKVQGLDGKPVTLHRTYLDELGRKADVASPRRLMPGKIDKGCAIRLAEAGPIMGIAEGIETALSASIIWSVPCWAAVSAGMLMAWEPPAETKEIIIFGDNDPGFAGQSAAFGLAHKLSARGLKVRVEMPTDAGLDWNDVLQAERVTA